MSRKTPQEQLSQVKLEIANLTHEDSQLRNLSIVAMTLSKTALKTLNRLRNKAAKLLELKGELELIVKIIEGVDFVDKDIEDLIFWHCRLAEHMQNKSITLYEYADVSRMWLGNIYDIVFMSNKKFQRHMKKHGLRYRGKTTIKKDDGSYSVS
jgi:hypothetical protein